MDVRDWHNTLLILVLSWGLLTRHEKLENTASLIISNCLEGLFKNSLKKQSKTVTNLLPQYQIHLLAVFWVFHNEKLKRVIVTKPVWDLCSTKGKAKGGHTTARVTFVKPSVITRHKTKRIASAQTEHWSQLGIRWSAISFMLSWPATSNNIHTVVQMFMWPDGSHWDTAGTLQCVCTVL